MQRQRSLTSLITGASVTMISLTSLALVVLSRNSADHGFAAVQPVWPMIMASSVAIILVMSHLHGELRKLYRIITEREERAHKDARLDALTGLGNRKFLIEQLEARLAPGASDGRSALLLIDLNNFKRVNDTLGHAIGDQLIMAVATRLRSAYPDAIAARLGGDEFALIIDRLETVALSQVCETVANRLSAAFPIGGHSLLIGGSVGAAHLAKGLDVSKLMQRADAAMYRAKSAQCRYQIFDTAMIAAGERRADLAMALRECLEQGIGIFAVFQTVVSPERNTRGLEALLRWQHDTLGEISPLEIISIAEEVHLLNEVGLFMAREAAKAAAVLPRYFVAFNLRAVQLLTPEFVDGLIRIAKEHGVANGQLHIEIHERDFVDRGSEIALSLELLRSAGFRIAVDDFGTSTSSLTMLRDLGITTLKLDPCILKTAREDASIAFMRAKVSLAKALGMTVVCEGIDSAFDESAAIQAGCDLMQGFRFSRPTALVNFLKGKTGKRTSRVAAG